MSEHTKRLLQVATLLDETCNGMAAVGVDKAVEHLESLEQQLAASQAREAELRKCVELYADQPLWQRWMGEPRLWVSSVGPKPAQECLKKVEAMK